MKKEKNDMPLTHIDDSRDYLAFDSLRARAGVNDTDLIKLVVKELVDNALDNSEKCDIGMIDKNGFFIQDYGKGIELDDDGIAYLFSVVRKTYTTKGSRLVTRGAFGRGLRVVAGMVSCHDATLYVSTGGRKLLLTPHQEGTDCHREGPYHGKGTRIEIIFKESISEQDLEWGKLAIKMSQGNKSKGYSSPWWYDSLSFLNLLKGLSYNGNSIKNSLSKIFGPFSTKKIEKDLRPLLRGNTAEEITRPESKKLLAELRRVMTRKIQPKALGCVGDIEGFRYYQKQYGNYIDKIIHEKVEIPFVLELWAKPVQVGSGESKNSKVVLFVNNSPLATNNSSILDTQNKSYFSLNTQDNKLYEFDELKANTTFYLNIRAPYLPRTGEAKLLIIPEGIHDDIQKIFNKLVKKINSDFNPAKNSRKKADSRSVLMNPNTQRIIKENKKSINNLLNEESLEGSDKKYLKILARDPFMTGLNKPTVDRALWFKDVWNSYNSEGKIIHLRRLHYRLVSSSQKIKKHDGKDYVNDNKSWKYLLETSKCARELEMVDPLQIVDERNPEPYGIFDPNYHLPTKIIFSPWRIPEIDVSRFQLEKFDMPSLDIDEALASVYASSLQPVHLEIWVEKSTMNDILEEICKYYGIILVQTAGYSSITGIDRYFLQRALVQNKPSIIFYISDYDKAGENMPVQVARTIQHRIYKMKANGSFPEGKEIIVQPIILTQEQMESEEFKDLRKLTEEEDHPTELDALEAIMPGKFKEIVEENIQKVLNVDIISEMPLHFNNAKQKFKNILHSVTGELENEIATLRSNLDKVTEKYKTQLQDLSENIMQDYAPHKKRIMEIEVELSKYANEKAQSVSIDIEVLTSPQLENPLFNSSRKFKEQTIKLDKYRIIKAKRAEIKKRKK